jgi:hypothetical protein
MRIHVLRSGCYLLISVTTVQECDPRYSSGQAQQTLISDLKPVTKNYFFLSHYMPVAYGFAFLTPIYIAVQPK